LAVRVSASPILAELSGFRSSPVPSLAELSASGFRVALVAELSGFGVAPSLAGSGVALVAEPRRFAPRRAVRVSGFPRPRGPGFRSPILAQLSASPLSGFRVAEPSAPRRSRRRRAVRALASRRSPILAEPSGLSDSGYCFRSCPAAE
jgi:hypothetical protein